MSRAFVSEDAAAAAAALLPERPVSAMPNLVTPSQSKTKSPAARQGCTTVSGASNNAKISSGHPKSPSAVAPSHFGFRTNFPIRESRSESP